MIVGIFIDKRITKNRSGSTRREGSYDFRKRVERLSREESCVLVRSWTVR